MKTQLLLHHYSMKRCIASWVLFFCSQVLWGQISGRVWDEKSLQPIQGAWVVLDNGRSSFTNEKGEYSIQDNRLEQDQIQIQVLMTGFSNWRYVGPKRDVPREILLLENTKEMAPLEIVEGPEVVFGSDVWNVGDFVWDDNGDLVMLIYDSEERWKRQEDAKRTLFNGVKLLRMKSDTIQHQKEYRMYPIPGLAEGFYDQFPGEIIVKGYNQYFMLREDQLFILPDSVMKSEIMPVVDTLGNADFVMSDFQASYPAFDYYIANENKWMSIHHLEDEKEMELFRSEFKYLGPKEKVEAYQFQLDTGVDKEIIAAYMRGFPQSHYHTELNAPLLILGDTITILDHLHSKCFRFDKMGKQIDEKKIEYHHLKGMGKWLGKIYKDPASQHIYTAYLKAGKVTLFEIDLRNSSQKKVLELTHPYVDRIRIRDRQIFYIYRPFESSQKRYLYSEKIYR
ncbi:MAG: hypothetical protein RL362_386 [Bacteroidota bacterium]